MLNETLKTKEKSAFPCLVGRSGRISATNSLRQVIRIQANFISIPVASFIATRSQRTQPSIQTRDKRNFRQFFCLSANHKFGATETKSIHP